VQRQSYNSPNTEREAVGEETLDHGMQLVKWQKETVGEDTDHGTMHFDGL